MTMDAAFHRFQVGSLECVALSDGAYTYEAARFFANADAAEVAAALARHGLAGGRIPSPYTCLLVEAGGARVLLDTGGAGWDPGVGRLRESLRLAGVEPSSIDVVVLTHGHPDHIGGNAEHGVPVYAAARHVMAADEWAFWSSPDTLARLPEKFQAIAKANLPPLAGLMDLVDGEQEVVPGIRVLPTPGHTPGHLAVVVEDGGDELLYISDAALHPIHLEHPGWYPVYDIDPPCALASKRMLFDRAARQGSLVLAYHFDPFPCLGHVREAGEGWRWEPLPQAEPGGGWERSSATDQGSGR
jgi:glyoxylase-like metal-dependent hydrolase (beta-lactamase superfamily II)